jgi:DNA (cytosine-5)-methyltransferase 1
MRALSLFSGIGGMCLGLERAGVEIVAFCEQDPFCRSVLKKHWPDVVCYEDVQKLCILAGDRASLGGVSEDGEVACVPCGDSFSDCGCIGLDQFRDTHGDIDLLYGGFPCQDLSVAGKGAGLNGERSGLWWEMFRIIERLGPPWVIIENVPGLRSRGSDEVLGSMEEAGYSCWPLVVEAAAFGAAHKRERVFIVATNDPSKRVEGLRATGLEESHALSGPFLPLRTSDGQWEVEPDLRRTPNGLPRGLDARRLKALGNAVCPPVAEAIGRAIMEVANG